jgi:type IX secretion system PorP/SprF family membrane protein
MSSTVHRFLFVVLLALASIVCRGQQQSLFTQYMFNGLVLNPAYAGAQETLTATAVFRRQWIGIEGAPETQTLSAHTTVDALRQGRRPGSPVSVGITLFNDEIAITGHRGMLLAYAYRIALSEDTHISFGLQGGFSQMTVRYSSLGLDDPSFSTGDVVEWQPEFGAGLWLRHRRFYAGVSSPQMFRTQVDAQASSFVLAPHYFLTTGYIFDVATGVKIKPHVLLRSFDASIFQWDLNCNVFVKEIVNVGVSYRSSESVSAMVGVQFHTRFALGYAYDIPFESELSRAAGGSHEIMLNYQLPKKRITPINPRFF